MCVFVCASKVPTRIATTTSSDISSPDDVPSIYAAGCDDERMATHNYDREYSLYKTIGTAYVVIT